MTAVKGMSDHPTPELDVAIAIGVLGWTNVRPHSHIEGLWQGNSPDVPNVRRTIPFSSIDMTSVWHVVRHIARDERVPVENRNLQLTAYCYNRTYAHFGRPEDDNWCEGNGKYATPVAICLAALKVLGLDQ